jgi:hypothetical protein
MPEEREIHPVADIFPMMSSEETTQLCEDIRVNGQQEPIWLHPDGRIIDGRNRYRACLAVNAEPTFKTWDGRGSLTDFVVSRNLHRRHLNGSQKAVVALEIEKWYAIEAQERKSALIAASNQRRALLVDEQQDSLVEIVPPMETAPAAEETPEKSRERAGKQVGVSGRYVQEAKSLAEKAPELMADVKSGKLTLSKAKREVVRAEREAALQHAIEEMADTPSPTDLRVGDFREILADIPDGSVDAIITDPPYPAEFLPLYGRRNGHEDDGLPEFQEDGLAEIAGRILKPGGICAVMVGQSYLPEIFERMTHNSGLTYHWTLAYLTPGGQAVQVWQRKVNTFWKPILVFTKGEYTGDWFGDVAKSAVNDNDKRFHEWGQSESGMVDLINRLTKPGELIVDPFLGAGTTGVAAIATARRFIGCDIDAAHVTAADVRIRQAAA